ncbi:PAS domain S-box protein [Microcoleus vaginatus GB1-A2]|uniref:PAS domain S-box protein n=1 Tax=Microcoleus vaginatus TaxID=119532 RepID=UPI0016858662|nr:PAS domain S-box protein [Microcoleus sp. FACHB-61]
MCSDPTKIDRHLETCEALVAEQKAKIRQLEDNLQQQRELCQKLEAQLKAVENADSSAWVSEFDITEDDRIELIASLEKSQEMYRTLIKHYPNGSVFLFDRDLRYTLVDGQGLAVVGLSKEQLEGKTLWEVSPPEDWPIFETKYRAALAGKENTFEYKYGDRVYSTTIAPVKNDREEIFAGMVVTQDITEKKQAEIALEAIKNHLEIRYKKRTEDLKTANNQLQEEIIYRWRAEEALRESQEQLELFFSQSLDGFFFMMLDEPVHWDNTVDKEKVLDYVFAKGRVTKANDALIAQYGGTREEFIGRTLYSFLSHNLTAGREIIRQFFDAGRIHIENDNRKLNGVPVWVEGDYICIYDSHGRIAGYFGVQRDISDRKQAEAALKESEERFRQLAENIESVFWMVNVQPQEIIYISPAYEKIWGRSCAELYAEGRFFPESLHPEDRDRVIAHFNKQIESEDEIEYRIVRPDGKIRWLRDRAFPLRNQAGQVYRIVGIAVDISAGKQGEQAIRESEERFRQLAENSQDCFWLISAEFTDLLYLSPAYEQIWGRSREKLSAEPLKFMQWVHPEDKHLLQEAIRRVLQGESPSTEYRFFRSDGTMRWVCDRAFPIYDESGKIYRIAGIAEDISDRKFTEARIQAALREKEVLIKEIHHRVKNNMQVISSLLQLQAQYIEDEPTLALFEESQTRIHSMALIHEQLYQSEHLDRIDLPPYVENLVANLYQSFGCGNTGIQFNLNLDPIYLNIETAIPCGLIINEVVSNSLKYAFFQSLAGEINIDFHLLNSQQFQLIIRDNGSGFPPGFDVENAETLGLRLVRMLANQLEASIAIDSQCGTCYTLMFKELNYRRRI